jgi:hypothetical protein
MSIWLFVVVFVFAVTVIAVTGRAGPRGKRMPWARDR